MNFLSNRIATTKIKHACFSFYLEQKDKMPKSTLKKLWKIKKNQQTMWFEHSRSYAFYTYWLHLVMVAGLSIKDS